MTYFQELEEVIQRLHGAKATHVESVPVRETFASQVAWEGTVEVFNLEGHPTATKAYAWSHELDDPGKRRFVAILHSHPIQSAEDAVRAFILQESRNLGTTAAD